MKLAIAGMMVAVWVCGAQPLQFEVASVKLSAPRAPGTGQGTRGCSAKDPIRYVCTNANVGLLVIYAYDLKGYQIRPPIVGDTVLYDVTAKVPPGTTKEQIKEMLRTLLAERFKLMFHREQVERPGYALVVAKGGSKMKESSPDDSPMPTKPAKDADGFVYIPPRNRMAVGWANGLTRWAGNNIPVGMIAGLGNSLTSRPVIDATGLTGKYDFMLTFAPDGAPPDVDGVNVFAAFEQQLGLKLEARKIPIEEFVIDHVEKAPIDN
jgi:uncharacterized protein (TIGR03435 family)